MMSVQIYLCRTVFRMLFCVQLYKDLLHPSVDEEKRRCKLKRLVQSPNSYFMDVKCPGGCFSLAVCMIIPHFRNVETMYLSFSRFFHQHCVLYKLTY